MSTFSIWCSSGCAGHQQFLNQGSLSLIWDSESLGLKLHLPLDSLGSSVEPAPCNQLECWSCGGGQAFGCTTLASTLTKMSHISVELDGTGNICVN